VDLETIGVGQMPSAYMVLRASPMASASLKCLRGGRPSSPQSSPLCADLRCGNKGPWVSSLHKWHSGRF